MKPIVLAVTGASAQQIAERAIFLLLDSNYSIKLILSRGAYEVWNSEIGVRVPLEPILQENFWRKRLNITSGNLDCYRWNDNAADIASGSYHTQGMAIIPCTMGTIGRISAGFSLNLIERCADVHLKERRTLLIAPRESPFNLIHLRNMTTITEAGGIICPLIPAWYTNPESLEQMLDFIVVRLFDNLGLKLLNINRWCGPNK